MEALLLIVGVCAIGLAVLARIADRLGDPMSREHD